MARLYSSRKLYHEHRDRFFREVQEGQVYEYYYGHFLFSDVQKLAGKYGVKIQYLAREDPRRKGSYSFLVTKVLDKVEVNKEPQMFDIGELAI
ncbi:MAG: hypothetical protein R3267_04285 [Paenisporosarcina sp.]|nr:hypothetical protein [Paenisporosarcina sp.]